MKWEYKNVILRDINGMDLWSLNNYGQEGWELVSITPLHPVPDYNPYNLLYVFKRQIA